MRQDSLNSLKERKEVQESFDKCLGFLGEKNTKLVLDTVRTAVMSGVEVAEILGYISDEAESKRVIAIEGLEGKGNGRKSSITHHLDS